MSNMGNTVVTEKPAAGGSYAPVKQPTATAPSEELTPVAAGAPPAAAPAPAAPGPAAPGPGKKSATTYALKGLDAAASAGVNIQSEADQAFKSNDNSDWLGDSAEEAAAEKQAAALCGACCTGAKEAQKKHGDQLSTWQTISFVLVKALPSLSYDTADLDKRNLAVPFALFFILSYILIFLVYFLLGLDTATASRFLSASGTTSAQVCTGVPASVTGTFLIDTYGYWSTSKDFNISASVFSVTFTGSTISLDTYSAIMTKFSSKVKALDTLIAANDLSFTILAWSTFYFDDAASGISIKTIADPAYIFTHYESLSLLLSGMQIDATDGYSTTGTAIKCSSSIAAASTEGVDPTATTSPDGLVLYAQWAATYDEVTAAYPCGTNGYPASFTQPCPNLFEVSNDAYISNFLYFQQCSGGTNPPFAFSFDMRSMMVAAAFNFGILTVDDLDVFEDPTSSGIISSAFGKTYVHPSFKGMQEIFIYTSGTKSFAFLLDRFITFFAVPFYQTNLGNDGNGAAFYSYCACSNSADQYFGRCNQFSTSIRVLTWFNGYGAGTDGPLAHRVPAFIEFVTSILALIPSGGVTSTTYYSTVQDKVFPANMDITTGLTLSSICGTTNGCSVFEFTYLKRFTATRLNGNVLLAAMVSPLTHTAEGIANVENDLSLACQGNMYQKTTITKMISTPPVMLTQAYQTCKATKKAAAQTTIGNANSIAATLSALALSIFITVGVAYANATGSKEDLKIRSVSDKLAAKELNDKLTMDSIPFVQDMLLELLESMPEEAKSKPAAAKLLENLEKKREALAAQRRKLEEEDEQNRELIQNGGALNFVSKKIQKQVEKEVKKEIMLELASVKKEAIGAAKGEASSLAKAAKEEV